MYSRFEGLPYGTPGIGGSGLINFNLGNNLEMKLRNDKDTIDTDKKVKILESLNISTNYNLMADSLNWAPINISARTKVKILDITINGTLDPYAIAKNEYGNWVRINTFNLSNDNKLVRLTILNTSVGFSLNSNARKEENSKVKTHSEIDRYATLYGYPEQYIDFNVPWNIRINYSLRYSKPYDETNITQTLNVSGDLSLTDKWKISVTSGYDIENKKPSYTTINIHRDLHCWEASLYLVPFGQHKSYMFQINVKAAMLKDLKLAKRRSWYDNF